MNYLPSMIIKKLLSSVGENAAPLFGAALLLSCDYILVITCIRFRARMPVIINVIALISLLFTPIVIPFLTYIGCKIGKAYLKSRFKSLTSQILGLVFCILAIYFAVLPHFQAFMHLVHLFDG